MGEFMMEHSICVTVIIVLIIFSVFRLISKLIDAKKPESVRLAEIKASADEYLADAKQREKFFSED